MQLFIFPLCKFFESQVQVLMGFLTRPVTADQSHYDARHSEDEEYYDCCFHMIRVPCSLPSMRLIAIAEMNMPAMIHTRSIISMPIFPRAQRSHSR